MIVVRNCIIYVLIRISLLKQDTGIGISISHVNELERQKATEFRTLLLYTGLVLLKTCPDKISLNILCMVMDSSNILL